MINDEISRSVEEIQESALAVKSVYENHEDEIEELSEAFKTINVISATLDNYSIDISVSGDKDELGACFSALRSLGYEPDVRPGKPEATFSTYFHRSGCHTVWLCFSSTVCVRKKVGTKMQEIDVYEVVCE